MYDLIVVGGGPAGSHVARRLAGLGYKVVVFEEHEKIGEPTHCTGIIGKECFDFFPIYNNAILREASCARFFAPSGKSIRLWKDTVQAYIIDRAAFDLTLAEMAQEDGASYLLGSRVKDMVVGDDYVTARVICQGETVDFEARTAVIASGFGSRLPQQLGLGKIGDFIMGAQAEVDVNEVEEVEVYFGQGIAPGFFAWLVPTFQNKALVGLLSRRSPGQHLRDLLSSLFLQGKIASPEVKIGYGGIPLKPLPKTYRERVIVVGDAAGQVKPTTGGGVYYGLLCAEVAADTLHRALSNADFSGKVFARYERKWKKKLSREMQIGHYARKFYDGLSDRQIEEIFDIIESDNIHELLLQSEDFSFDWHGGFLLRALRHLALRGVIGVMKKPIHPFLKNR